MQDELTISELEILIQSMEDWLLAERNQSILELINQFSSVQTTEQIQELKNQIKIQKIKQEEKLKEKSEIAILLQGKLIRKKRKLLNNGMEGLKI
jgi:hypothetical protein